MVIKKGGADGGRRSNGQESGTKIRLSLVIATFIMYVLVTSCPYLYVP